MIVVGFLAAVMVEYIGVSCMPNMVDNLTIIRDNGEVKSRSDAAILKTSV